METTWQKNWKPNKIYPKLREDIEVDVVIVGGGITGITLAYLLSKGGKRVVVFEKGTLRESTHTAYTTAMLMEVVDTTFVDLIKIWGRDTARAVWESGRDALLKIEEIVRDENIACDYKKVPAYVYANTEGEWKVLKNDADAIKKENFQIETSEKGNKKENQLKIPNFGYYKIENQAKFHALKYCDALRMKAESLGAKFYENTEVLNIENGRPAILHTKSAKIKADWAIVATYDPFNKPKELFTKKGTYITYMIELSVEPGTLPEGLYMDGANPYHYFRVDKEEGRDRILIGGADHRKEIKMDPEKNYAEILEYSDKILGKGNYQVECKWDGGILETIDGLPLIGSYSKEHPNILVATGFSGNGITYSTIASVILADKVLGKDNKYEKLFDPKRSHSVLALLIKGRDYIKTFFNGALRNIFRKAK